MTTICSLPSLRSLAQCASTAVTMIALSSGANAESVVFSGAEGSSNSSYAYLGTVIPMEGEQLGRG